MSKKWTFIGAVVVVAVLAVAVAAYGAAVSLPGQYSANLTRPCIPVLGAPTRIVTTTASVATGALTVNASFYLTCDTDTFVRWGSAAPTAVATDHLVKATDPPLRFVSHPSAPANFVATFLAAGAGICSVLECR